MYMDYSKISKIVSILIITFNLNSWQKDKLNYYVRMNQNQWIAERKREEEIEEILKQEVQRIASE